MVAGGLAGAGTRSAEKPAFWIFFLAVVSVLAVVPLWFPNDFWQRLLTEVLILGLLAMSSDLLIGYVRHGVLRPRPVLRHRLLRAPPTP